MTNREKNACIALLEKYMEGGIGVYDNLIQSFNESKNIIGNVSMNFEDIVKMLNLSRNQFSKIMKRRIEAFQGE